MNGNPSLTRLVMLGSNVTEGNSSSRLSTLRARNSPVSDGDSPIADGNSPVSDGNSPISGGLGEVGLGFLGHLEE